MTHCCQVLVLALLLSGAVHVDAASPVSFTRRGDRGDAVAVPAGLPWQDLSERCRTLVTTVSERPTLAAKGTPESFFCDPQQYLWFLDHPDRAVVAWRRLGAKCVGIAPRPGDKFAWNDDMGSEIVWEAVHRGPKVRVWYAEGKVRPGPVLPLIPVKAVVILAHVPTKAANGDPVIQHRSELFVQTDSRAAAMLTKMAGSSAQHAAEEGLGQLQLFFSGVSWYLARHPNRAADLLAPGDENVSTSE